MAYGIEVFDSNGKTVFNTENYVEMIAYKATVVDGAWLLIPGWCYGQNQDVAGSSSSITNIAVSTMTASGGGYTNNFEIAFPTSAGNLVGRKWDQYMVGSQFLISIRGTYYNNGGTAYYIYNTTRDVSALRTSTAGRTVIPYTYYEHIPTIYARPQSSSYSGDFVLETGEATTSEMVSTDRYNRKIRILDKASGTNTFEILVAMPAKDWGGITGTKAHQAGTATYGLEALTAGGQQFHSGSTAGQFTTYNSLGRPSKVLLAKGVDHGSNSVSTTSLGSLTTSSTKRYCRMTGTQYGHNEYVSGSTKEYRQHYSWASNNSISLKWTNIATATNPAHIFYSGLSTIVFDNYDGKQLFAIADFGLGM